MSSQQTEREVAFAFQILMKKKDIMIYQEKMQFVSCIFKPTKCECNCETSQASQNSHEVNFHEKKSLCDVEALLLFCLNLNWRFLFLWLVPENTLAAWDSQSNQKIKIIPQELLSHQKGEDMLCLFLYKSYTNMTWILQQCVPFLKTVEGL